MRNLILFGTVLLTLVVALYIGVSRFDVSNAARAETGQPVRDAPEAAELSLQERQAAPQMPASVQKNVPHIGSIQVLNGCNIDGAARRMAEFLRSKNFDVKDIDNASTRNHQATMVISRSTNMSLANEVEKILKTGKVVLMRNNEQLYDVTVIVGPDYAERIK
jgi:hypothetical protein